MLTRSSVHWAERMVATSSWKGPSWTRAQRSLALPGYSPASRATASRARPRRERGRAMASGYRAAWPPEPFPRRQVAWPEMHPVEVKRRMGESDIAEVSQLLQQALVADGHYPLGEHKWLDLVHGGRKGFAGFVARESAGGHLVGYAQLSRGHDTWSVEVVVRPDHRKPDAEVGVSLLQAVLREVGRQGG